MKYIYTLLLGICIYTSTAQSVQPDPSWAGQGYLITGSAADVGHKILLQPDGKVILCGYQRDLAFSQGVIGTSTSQSYSHQILTLLRYHPDGTPDASFGTGGKLQFYTGLSNYSGAYPTPALQTDGKVLIGMSLLNADSTALDFALYRITADGRIDSTFGSNGLVRNNIDSVHNVNVAVMLLPDGKIIQAGTQGCVYCNQYGEKILVLQKYKDDGSRDSTFGVNGVIDSIRTHLAINVSLRPSGSFLVENFITPYMISILPDGSRDLTFAIPYSFVAPHSGLIPKYLETADGIYMGYEGTYGPDTVVGLAKRKTDGTADSTWNGTGYSQVSLLKSNIVQGIAQQPDHKMLLLVQTAYYDTTVGIQYYYKSSASITRFLTDGSIDRSFATNGTYILDTLTVDGQLARDIVVQPDGKILVVGQGSTNSQAGILAFRLLNFLDVGIIDFKATTAVLEIYPNPIHATATLSYELTSDETISLDLYDMTGRLIQNVCAPSAKTKGQHSELIHLDDKLSPGAYMLRVSNGGGAGHSVKVIIQ